MRIRHTLYQCSLGLLLFTALLSDQPVRAQDLHFSQYYRSPLSTNPANTGFLPDADYRAGVQYRNQFSQIMLQPYRTYSAYADAQLFRDRFENGWIGGGLLLMSDVAGSGSLQSNKVYASLAYHQMIANSSLISAGFNLGWVNKRINPANLKFPDQFDGRFFDQSLPTAVVLNQTSVDYFDLQAGLNYAYFHNDNIYVNAGYSIHHVNRPRESFFSSDARESRIPARHIGFVDAMFKTGDQVILEPSVYYTYQSGSSSLVGGLMMQYNLMPGGNKQLLLGAYHRWKESVIPTAGLQIAHLAFQFSYDVTLSSLRNFNGSRGAAEFSMTYRGFYPGKPDRQSLCPGF